MFSTAKLCQLSEKYRQFTGSGKDVDCTQKSIPNLVEDNTSQWLNDRCNLTGKDQWKTSERACLAAGQRRRLRESLDSWRAPQVCRLYKLSRSRGCHTFALCIEQIQCLIWSPFYSIIAGCRCENKGRRVWRSIECSQSSQGRRNFSVIKAEVEQDTARMECLAWEHLERKMEIGYDRGALMYINRYVDSNDENSMMK